MSLRLLATALLASIALFGSAEAADKKSAPKKDKPPEEAQADKFYEKLQASAKSLDQAQMNAMIDMGLTWLSQHASYKHAPNLMRDLGGFAMMIDAKRPDLRSAYTAQLQYQLVSRKFKPGLTDETKAAYAGVEVMIADSETRMNFTKAAQQELRSKIDSFAAMPASGPFLVPIENAYVDLLTRLNPALGEKHLSVLAAGPHKELAAWAQKSLNIAEIRKHPIALKFTTIDGKEVDLAQYRGKALAVTFFETGNGRAKSDLETLMKIKAEWAAKGFDVVAISYDKEEKKQEVQKMIADMKLPFPVVFDGMGEKNEFGNKLSIEKVPATALFDQKGILVFATGRAPDVGNELKRLFAPPKADAKGKKR